MAPADRVRWETQLVHLDAASIELQLDDCIAYARAPFEADSGRANIEVVWEDQGRRQVMRLNVAADETHWWLDSIAFGPASAWGGDALKALTLTPRGESYVGDLELVDTARDEYANDPPVPTSLTIRDLRLTAFAAWPGPIGSVPPRLAWLEGCATARFSKDQRIIDFPDGTRIARAKLEAMTPQEAESFVRDSGTCFVFHHSFATERSGDGTAGYGATRCSAPEVGHITGVQR